MGKVCSAKEDYSYHAHAIDRYNYAVAEALEELNNAHRESRKFFEENRDSLYIEALRDYIRVLKRFAEDSCQSKDSGKKSEYDHYVERLSEVMRDTLPVSRVEYSSNEAGHWDTYSTHIEYDEFCRVRREVSGSQVCNYYYDHEGNLKTRSHSVDGQMYREESYYYSHDDLLYEIFCFDPELQTRSIEKFYYDTDGNIVRKLSTNSPKDIMHGVVNGTWKERLYHYDENGRLTRIDAATCWGGHITEEVYRYDEEGRVREITHGNPENIGIRHQYRYDERGRLKRVDHLRSIDTPATAAYTEYLYPEAA